MFQTMHTQDADVVFQAVGIRPSAIVGSLSSFEVDGHLLLTRPRAALDKARTVSEG